MTPANVEVIVLSSDTEDSEPVMRVPVQQQQKKKRRRVEAVQNAIVDGGNTRGKEREKNGAGDGPAAVEILSSDPRGSDSRSEEGSKSMAQLQREMRDMKRRLLNMEKVSFHRLLRCTREYIDDVLVILFQLVNDVTYLRSVSNRRWKDLTPRQLIFCNVAMCLKRKTRS